MSLRLADSHDSASPENLRCIAAASVEVFSPSGSGVAASLPHKWRSLYVPLYDSFEVVGILYIIFKRGHTLRVVTVD